MHFSFLTRGAKDAVDKFINDLQAQYFPMENEKQKVYTQLIVRPVQLWEVIFPEEHLDEVLNTIQPGVFHKFYEKYFGILRKIIKFDKIPKERAHTRRRLIYNKNIEIVPIGIKKDKRNENGTELL